MPEDFIEIGTVFSHYRVIQNLGSGGMGEVYLAEDTALKRDVALKFMPAEAASDTEAKRRFMDEARAAASLNHPNIVTIYEVDEYCGRPFYAMEYIVGKTLDHYLKQTQMSSAQVIDIAGQICRGLHDAHRLGMIHRDIKPSNIIIDDSGQVKVFDFGLAVSVHRLKSGDADYMEGTIAYMSPEQFQDGGVTTASDLFSLGVVMYEMVTGRRPFTGEYDASLGYAIANEDPIPIREISPETPEDLAAFIFRLLEKNAADRYQNAGEALAELRRMESVDVGFWSGVTMRRSSRLFVVGMVIFIMAAAVLYGLRDKIIPRNHEKKTFAVLPFENLGESGDDYFADGMTDAVTTHLARFEQLAVISRTSSMQYKGTDKNLKQIGFELGAEYILIGTIQWDKSSDTDRVKIGASLVRVDDDTYLWTESYERVIDKVFAMQSEIATEVTDALNIAVGKDGRRVMQREPTRNLEAYDLYLRGNEYFNRSYEKKDIEFAVNLFSRAVELDPDFAEAYAMLSRGHGMMYSEYFDRSEERLRRAGEAVERALAIAPDLVEGHLAKGYCYYCEMNYQAALEEFAVVRKLQPNNRYLYNAIAAVQRRQGNMRESVENFIKALELDPLSHLRAFDVALTYGLMRKYSEAEKFLDRAILLAPDWPLPYVYRAWLYILSDGNVVKAGEVLEAAATWVDFSRSKYYWWLARIVEINYEKVIEATAPGTDTAAFYLHRAQMYRMMDNREKERAYSDSARVILLQKMSERSDEARYHSYLGLAYAGLRYKDTAIFHGKKGVELLPTSRDAFDAIFLQADLAEIYVIFGENEAAVDQLEHLLSIPGLISVSYLKRDPLWRPLRNLPRFKELVGQKVEGDL